MTILVFTAGGVIGLLLFAMAPLVWEWIAWSDARVEESMARGDRIVEALDAYHKRFDSYPMRIEDLQRGYLFSIQSPSAGNRTWIYSADQDLQAFTLAFAMNGSRYPIVYYDSESKRWYDDR